MHGRFWGGTNCKTSEIAGDDRTPLLPKWSSRTILAQLREGRAPSRPGFAAASRCELGRVSLLTRTGGFLRPSQGLTSLGEGGFLRPKDGSTSLGEGGFLRLSQSLTSLRGGDF